MSINKEGFFKTLVKCVGFGVLLSILLFIIALIIVKVSEYALSDVLFVEGVAFIIIGVLSSLGGNPMGLSLQSMGQNNSQYVSNTNLEISKREKENEKIKPKEVFSSSINMFSFVLAGLVCILLNFLV